MKYAMPVEEYGQPCVEIRQGETPFPEGSVWPVTLELDGALMIIEGGILREKTAEEKQAYLSAKQIIDALVDTERQLSKSLVLKQVENDFLMMCDTLTGGTTHAKLGFAQMEAIGATLPADVRTQAALNLLIINSKGIKEGGLQWWDDCVWHPEIVE